MMRAPFLAWQDDQAIPDAMRMMRAADPQRKEDGFQLLHEHVTEHTDELIASA
jgi:hypothetical protein